MSVAAHPAPCCVPSPADEFRVVYKFSRGQPKAGAEGAAVIFYKKPSARIFPSSGKKCKKCLLLWNAAAPERQAAQEEEEAAPEEGREAVPGPGESSGAFSPAGPEYQDGGGQSSVETSKVLHEILGELKMILGGVRSLSLSSAVSRRSAGSGGAEPGAVLGRADTNAAEGSSFKTYCIEGILAILGSILLGMVLCCAFHFWRKRKK
ncbi:uncharacterized protein LOC135287195 [Passer domesticus]|uniref:uncharacterized protein LOC135287195 n=1 Tax=Passer domesticus TaxID=48849 RepID=UPI0030FE2984